MNHFSIKKLAVFAFIFSLICHPSMLQAREVASQDMAQVMTESMREVNPFVFKITDDGGQLAKVGSVFTEGGHYEKMSLPYLLSNPAPIPYPRWAVRQGWEGRFDIAMEILKDGSVGRTKVMRSTGYNLLDQAAVKSVKLWKFHPAMENGQPAVTCIQMPVLFQIEKD